MPIRLSLPAVDPNPANPPETRPAKVGEWLDEVLRRSPVEAAGVIGDALAATNRVAMSNARRIELAEKFWEAADKLWPQIGREYLKASHPLNGEALEAAKAAVSLAVELGVAFKHLLVYEADKRIHLGGQRLRVALVHRCLECASRVMINSFLGYSPIPPKTWFDAHAVYSFARAHDLHLQPLKTGEPDTTPERIYLKALLLQLANPYGFVPGQLMTVVQFLQEFCHWAKLTDVAPVHRMAKAVSIVPIGHDFPPFSANKGGSIEGSKLFLLTYDLAFQIQEQIRALEAGGPLPTGIDKDAAGRAQYVALLRRLLRQWAIPPARQFNRVPSRARVVMCAGLTGVWQYSRGVHAGVVNPPTGLPPMTSCQVINHTPAGYALRQIDANPTSLRIGELIALRVDGRSNLQVAMVRWFRNTLKGSGLEFGCELLSDHPEAATAAAEDEPEGAVRPVVVLPEEKPTGPGLEPSPPQVIVPAGAFGVEHALRMRRGNDTGFAVLTKQAEQGPGFEIYEFAAVA